MIEKWIKCRYILTVLLTIGMMNAFIMRVNMSVAIVAMVDAPEKTMSRRGECQQENSNLTTIIQSNSSSSNKPFNWNAQTRGWILGAFYYGYITTPLLGGWLEHRFGGKIVFGSAIFLSSLITLLLPLLSYMGPLALIAGRICLGIVQGPVYPSHHGMWGRWAPPMERSRLMSIAMSGPYIGVASAYIISGALAESNFFNGWPSIFYVTGLMGLVWCVLWAIFAFDSPETHPRIRKQEKKFLRNAIGKNECKIKSPPVPWLAIVRSPQVWSLFMAHFSHDWAFRNLSINLPSFIDQIVGLDITNNSVLSAIPFIVVCLLITIFGWTEDVVREKQYMSPITFKRILVFLGQVIPAIFLVGIGHIACNQAFAVFLVTMAVGFGGLSTPSILVNFAEIAPRFAGLLFGMSNTIAITSGQFAPLLVGYVTGTITNLRVAWQIVFYVGAAISALGGVIFMITVRVDVLPWAKVSRGIKYSDDDDELSDHSECELQIYGTTSEINTNEAKGKNTEQKTSLSTLVI